jgi:hypothetical protein
MILTVTTGGLPPGTYMAKFSRVEATRHAEFGDGMRWVFGVAQGPLTGQETSRVTGPTPTARNGCGRILAGIVGRELQPGETIDPASYIGRDYIVVVQSAEGGGSRVETVVPTPTAGSGTMPQQPMPSVAPPPAIGVGAVLPPPIVQASPAWPSPPSGGGMPVFPGRSESRTAAGRLPPPGRYLFTYKELTNNA